jgi:Domain of unknown function (DUF5664)
MSDPYDQDMEAFAASCANQPDDFNERVPAPDYLEERIARAPVDFQAAKEHVERVPVPEPLASMYRELHKACLATGKDWVQIYPPLTPAEQQEVLNTMPEYIPIGHAPTAAAARKALPVCTGCLDYFPDALLAVAELSRIGNDQHNPGQPLHWAKDKSTDEPDALLRHLIDRGTLDTDGVRHSAKVAWRALALLQREIEGERATSAATAKAPRRETFVVEVYESGPVAYSGAWFASAIPCRTMEEARLHAEGLRRERGCPVRILQNGAIEVVAMTNEPPLCELGD